jgi:hypothetical protein
LVVEDHPMNFKALTNPKETKPHPWLFCDTPEEALDAVINAEKLGYIWR